MLQQVHDGELPFDRTMRISTAEENAKEKVARRIPGEPCAASDFCWTLANEQDWELIEDGANPKRQAVAAARERMQSTSPQR